MITCTRLFPTFGGHDNNLHDILNKYDDNLVSILKNNFQCLTKTTERIAGVQNVVETLEKMVDMTVDIVWSE